MFANWLIMCGASTYFHIKSGHPYITSAKGLGGWGQKLVIFADIQYYQSHYREVQRWEIFMEQELRFGLDLGRLALLKKKMSNFSGRFFHVFIVKKIFKKIKTL
jgi:hypothetical protein